MSDYEKLIEEIIRRQEKNFGPVALEHAENVKGIEIDDGDITVTSENKEEVLIDLAQVYYRLVGDAISAALENEDVSDNEIYKKLEEKFEATDIFENS